MGRVIARVRAGVGSAPRVGRSARRCHSPGSGGANRLESSAGAMLGIPLSRRHVGGLLLAGPAGTIVGRSNTVSSGPLAWVMIHRHHAAERTGLGLDQNAWVSFGKQGWVNSRERRSAALGLCFDFDAICDATVDTKAVLRFIVPAKCEKFTGPESEHKEHPNNQSVAITEGEQNNGNLFRREVHTRDLLA